MANKERNKRSSRKARSQERADREAAQAATAPKAAAKPVAKEAAKAPAKAPAKKSGKPGFPARVRRYFSDVRAEMHRVVWPSKGELQNYTLAVIAMLVVFGVALWLVDTGVVAGLVAYSGLRG